MHGRSMLISLTFEVARPQLLQLKVSNARIFDKLTPKAQPVYLKTRLVMVVSMVTEARAHKTDRKS